VEPTAGAAHARLSVAWDQRIRAYDFGPGHPFDERPRELAVSLLEGSLEAEESGRLVRSPPIEPAPRATLERFHRPRYLDLLARADAAGDHRMLDAGDTPSFPGCLDASSRIVAATVVGLEHALAGSGPAFAPGGGLHHAAPDRASGFCILNDLAVAITMALDRGRSVAYVDLDAHHGDGVMYGFYGNGRVLDVDFHQDGRTLFPGTGSVAETGNGDGAGAKVNIPLPPGSGDEALVPLARRILPTMLEAFDPGLVVVQHGIDGHWGDPLAQLQYTPQGYAEVDRLLIAWTAERRRPVLWTGGGGYRPASVARVLARTARLAAGLPLAPDGRELPAGWRADFASGLGAEAPSRWVDPPRLSRSRWSRDQEDRLVAAIGAALGRRFPPGS